MKTHTHAFLVAVVLKGVWCPSRVDSREVDRCLLDLPALLHKSTKASGIADGHRMGSAGNWMVSGMDEARLKRRRRNPQWLAKN